MSFYTICKSVARDIVSCCDPTRIETRHSKGSPEVLHPEATTNFASLDSHRKTQRRCNFRSHKSWSNRRHRYAKALTLKKGEYGYPDATSDHITDRVFYYNTVLYSPQTEKPIYRRVLLSFVLSIDAISDDIARVLGLPILPYNGKAVQLHNGESAKPIGTLHLQWKIYNGKRVYKTKFLVIKDSHFDMLLGRSSIKKYKLWEVDGEIEKRLQYRY
jgi:hypothetical protein